jgi:hypothetical protein
MIQIFLKHKIFKEPNMAEFSKRIKLMANDPNFNKYNFLKIGKGEAIHKNQGWIPANFNNEYTRRKLFF